MTAEIAFDLKNIVPKLWGRAKVHASVPIFLSLALSSFVLCFYVVSLANEVDVATVQNTPTETSGDLKPLKDASKSSERDTSKPGNKAENNSSHINKQQKQSASKIPMVVEPNRNLVESNYRNALKIERDVGRNMRKIDNAIRQMNTDINRLRTIQRRF